MKRQESLVDGTLELEQEIVRNDQQNAQFSNVEKQPWFHSHRSRKNR